MVNHRNTAKMANVPYHPRPMLRRRLRDVKGGFGYAKLPAYIFGRNAALLLLYSGYNLAFGEF